MTKEDFITKATAKHGNRYNYEQVVITNNKSKLNIKCNLHGIFNQQASSHLCGNGCPKCGGTSKYSEAEFIEKAKQIHDNKYNYSKVAYKNNKERITIICPIHGDFTQVPSTHLSGHGCRKCSTETTHSKQTFSKSTFITKAKLVHREMYDYSRVNYINSQTKVIIICPEHGEFNQKPNAHLRGGGCKKCAVKRESLKQTFSNSDFINRATLVHNNKYDYSLVSYVNSQTKVKIICPNHGEFLQRATKHLRGEGCNKCAYDHKNEKYKLTLEEFKVRAEFIHNDKYIYDKAVYKNYNSKIEINCPIHNIYFKQTVANHLIGQGCYLCKKDKGIERRSTTEKFIEKAKFTHGNTYDYTKVVYVLARKKVVIICKKHGEFIQTPDQHIRGRGCPICRDSQGEERIRNFIIKNKIIYDREYRFIDCININPLPFDFAIFEDKEKTKLMCLIEYDGVQHFKAIDWFGGKSAFKRTQRNDKIKTDYCLTNKIKLIRIPYWEFKNIEQILKKELD